MKREDVKHMLKRNIKFPIILSNGFQVRTLEELKEHFEVETIVEYFLDGRLRTWLEQRLYTKELQLLQCVTDHNDSLPMEIFKIFGMNYEESTFNHRDYVEKRAKIEMINRYTSDQEILDNYEYVVTSQCELDILLQKMKDDSRTVYLLNDTGELFNVSDTISNIRYVGINDPIVILIGSDTFDAKGKNIVFQSVKIIADKETRIVVQRLKDYLPMKVKF
jgi:hypothetical protein